MKKTITILLMIALIVSLALVSCTPNDVPNDGADTPTDGEGTNGDTNIGIDNGNENSDENSGVKKNFVIVEDVTDIPVLPYDGAPDYYVVSGYVYKLFYSFDELQSFVTALKQRGIDPLISQCIGFDFQSDDYIQVWVFYGAMTLEQYETYQQDDKSAVDIDYMTNSSGTCVYSSVIYRDPQKHSSGMEMQPFVNMMAWEKHTYPALFETAGNFYKTLEGIKNDPLLAPMLETTGLIPHDYQRDLISFTGEKNTDRSYSYTLYYNGKSFAYINSCEELSEEFINTLIDGMRVMG